MKEKKNKEGETGKENFTIKKEASMMVSGKIIICMAMENFTIQIKNQHMKDNGLSINSMGEEKSIMMCQQRSWDSSISTISMIQKKNGSIMKEIWSQTQRKETGNQFYPTDSTMKDNSREIKFMEKEHSQDQTEK